MLKNDTDRSMYRDLNRGCCCVSSKAKDASISHLVVKLDESKEEIDRLVKQRNELRSRLSKISTLSNSYTSADRLL